MQFEGVGFRAQDLGSVRSKHGHVQAFSRILNP